MPSIQDAKVQDASNIGLFSLFKGDSGSGKTVGALSFCDTNNDGTTSGYVFDFDRKMPNIALKHFPRKKIDYDNFEDVFQVESKLKEFRGFCPYETLIFDSLTSLVNLVFKTVGNQRREDPVRFIRNMVPPGTKGRDKDDPNKMSIDYYNAESNFVESFFIDELKALWLQQGNPKNVIMTAHVITVESSPDLKTKEITVTRGIVTRGKKVGAYVPTQYDDVWHFAHENSMDTGETRRIVLTSNTGIDSAKTSLRLPRVIDFTGTSPIYEDGDLYRKYIKILKGDIDV